MKGPRKIEEELNVGELSKEIINEWYVESGTFRDEEKKQRPGIKEKKAIPLAVDVFRVQEIEKEVSEGEKKKALIKDKIKHLLNLGEKEGLVRAIKMANQSGDSFLLDVFHDILEKDENYKKLLKKNDG